MCRVWLIYFRASGSNSCYLILFVVNGELSRTREGSQFSHMRVRCTYKEKVPKHLIIDSCNLKLNETVGQGDIVNVVSMYYNDSYVVQENLALFTKHSCLKDSIPPSVKLSLSKH